ncbi:MAG: VOC family protein [Planctomycetota bacterium]|nr:VOC family protein [Planctomycetota bacterium]
MAIQVEALCHVTLPVTAVARAKAFYGGLLGLEEIERPKSFANPGAWYRGATAVIHLESQVTVDSGNGRSFCLWATDVREARRALQAAGVAIEEERRRVPGIARFFVHDPDGNRIELQGADETKWPA